MKLTMKKSSETYTEQNAIELSYYNILSGNDIVGKMKADYKTMTLRSFSGVINFNGVEHSVKGMKSMKEILAHFEELCSNSVVAVVTHEQTTENQLA